MSHFPRRRNRRPNALCSSLSRRISIPPAEEIGPHRPDCRRLRGAQIRHPGAGAGGCGAGRRLRGRAFCHLHRSQPPDQRRSALAPARDRTGPSLSAAIRHDSRRARRARSRPSPMQAARALEAALAPQKAAFPERPLPRGQRFFPPGGAAFPAGAGSRGAGGAVDRGAAFSRRPGAGSVACAALPGCWA